MVRHTDYGNRVYQASRVTLFFEYDISRFAGRIGHFMSNIHSLAD